MTSTVPIGMMCVNKDSAFYDQKTLLVDLNSDLILLVSRVNPD